MNANQNLIDQKQKFDVMSILRVHGALIETVDPSNSRLNLILAQNLAKISE